MVSLDAAPLQLTPLREEPERLLLLHCSAGNGSSWQRLRPLLEGPWEVIAPDIEGYGARRGKGLATGTRFAALVAPLARRLGEAGRVHLLGHSFGGALALELATALGPRLASLTLIEPVAFHLLRDGDFADRQLFREVTGLAAILHRALERGEPAAGMAAFLDYWNGAGAWASLEEQQRGQLSGQAEAVARDFRAIFAEPPALARYSRIVAPCLVLQGELSPRPVRRIAEILAQTLPWAAARRIHGAGHMLPLTHRETVRAAVLDQLVAFGPTAPLSACDGLAAAS